MLDHWSAAAYGEQVAEIYDEWTHGPAASEVAAANLAELADGGPVLETEAQQFQRLLRL